MREFKSRVSRYLSAILMVAMVLTNTQQMTMASVDAEPQEPEAVTSDVLSGETPAQTISSPTTSGVNLEVSENNVTFYEDLECTVMTGEYEVQCNLAPEVTVKYLYDGTETSVSGNEPIVGFFSEDLEFTVETQAGYEVDSVSVNGVEADDTYKPTYTISKETIAAGATLTITVKEIKHSLDYSIDEGAKILYGEDFATIATGEGTISGLNVQDDFRFWVEVESDYDLAEVTLNGTPISVSDNICTISENELQAEATAELVVTVTEREPVSDNSITFENPAEAVLPYAKKNVTGIIYNGVTYSSGTAISMNQTANTTKTYQMTVAGVDTNFNPEEDLKFDSHCADLYSGKVRISKTAYNKFDLVVTTPYEYTDDNEIDLSVDILMNGDSGEDQTVARVEVYNTLPTLKAPTVKVTEAIETTAKLTITDSAKLKVVSGNVYFQVSAKDANGDAVDLNGDTDGTMLYVPAKDYAGTETIILRELKEDGLKAANYTVTARTCIGRTVNGMIEYVLDSDVTNPNITETKVSLRNSVFETNLKLKKAASKIYPGQKNVVLATPVFSKATTPEFREVAEVWVTTPQGDYVGEGKDFQIHVNDEGSICADFGKNFYDSTYVLHVIPKCPETLYTKEATLTFKVLKGIFELDFSAKNVSIFRADNKKVTYTLPELIYNYDFKTSAPANKKVAYSIAPSDGNEDTTDNLKYVKINSKTGKVTIDKKYVLSSNEANATFLVTATAADFTRQNLEDNVTAEMTFIIKNTKNDIPYLTLCKYDKSDEKYHKVATTNGRYAVDGSAYIVATTKEISEDGISQCSEAIIPTDLYTLQIPNKNLKCTRSAFAYWVSADTIIRNVKITATTNDGGKKRKVIQNVTFEGCPNDLNYEVNTYYDKIGYLSVSDNEAVDVSVSVADNYGACMIDVYASMGNDKHKIVRNGNIDYSVKTDKGLEFYKYDESIFVRFTGKNLVNGAEGKKHATGKITFTYRVAGGTKRVETLTLTNDIPWIATAKPTIKQETALYTDGLEDQKIVLTVQENSQYKASGKYAAIFPLRSELNKKNAAFLENYNKLCEDLEILGGFYDVTEDGKVILTASPTRYQYKPGTYQYEVLFGTKDSKGHFIAETKAIKFSIKVSKAQSITPVTSYTLSAESSFVKLTAKKATKDTEYRFCEIQNVSIKGVENEFRKYFAFDEYNQTIYPTRAAMGATLEETQANMEALAKNTKDLKGYVTYKIDKTNIRKTVPIKIKIETKKSAGKKFTAELIPNEMYHSYDYSPILVQFNKAEAYITHAYTDAAKMAVTVEDKSVKIKGTDPKEKYTLKNVNIYVVNRYSVYESFLTNLKKAADADPTSVQRQAAYEEAMKKYGSKVILKKVTFEK